MSRLNVGMVAFGSGIRGIASEEESFSNAGIIEAPCIKSLILDFNATIYLMGPLQQRTRKIITGEIPEYYKDYYKHIVICDSVEQEPDNLDLIWISSGSDNLRMGGSYLDMNFPCAAFVYRVLFKYLKTPCVYHQTDFAAEFWIPESYGSIYSYLFYAENLWKYRKLHVLAAGKGASIYKKYHWMYNIPELVNIQFLPPDMHFMIDLDELRNIKSYKRSPVIGGVAFAGKQRQSGSRELILKDYIEKYNGNFELSGKWKEETVEQFKSSNSLFKYHGKLPEYKDVIEMYNRVGSTLYCSSPEYHEAQSVTSRFYDAIYASCVPFVHEPDVEVLREQFGNVVINLIVTPATITDKIKEFNDNPEYVDNVLNYINIGYKINHYSVREQFIEFISDIINNPEPLRSPEYLYNAMSSVYKDNLRNLKRNRPKSEEEFDIRVREMFPFHHNISLTDILSRSRSSVAMQLSLQEDFNNEDLMKKIDFLVGYYNG